MDRSLSLLRFLLVLTSIVSTLAHHIPGSGKDEVGPPISPEELAQAIADPSIKLRLPKDSNTTNNSWDEDDIILTPEEQRTLAHHLPSLGEDEVGPPISPEEFAQAIADPSIKLHIPKESNTTDNSWDEDDIIHTPEEQRGRISGIVPLWENRVIPYIISSGFSDSDRQVIAAAMADYHKYTCLKFVGRSSEYDYISIIPSNEGCLSYVGRIGGKQEIKLKESCFKFGTVIHEFMHAAGFPHEHTRPDRDSYIDILWDKVAGGRDNLNYKTSDNWPASDLRLQYDYKSVMHYGSSKITPKRSGTTIGQRDGFSPLDICGVNALYGCYSAHYDVWPGGSYGIPARAAGMLSCPCGWVEGTRYQDSEDSNNVNAWSSINHLAGSRSDAGIEHGFCIKNFEHNVGAAWPAGDYCIYQYGTCPSGFSSGYIYQDDEDFFNRNSHSGYLPSGRYDKNTQYNYCCRSDGYSSTPINLPTARQFYLFPYRSGCQQVSGMTASEEWLNMDNEDGSNANRRGGAYPKGEYGTNTKIYYCFYQ